MFVWAITHEIQVMVIRTSVSNLSNHDNLIMVRTTRGNCN